MLLFLKLIFHKQNFSDLFLTYWELFNLIKVYTSCVRMVKKIHVTEAEKSFEI